MGTVAIAGHGAGFCRECDQGVGGRRLDLGETTADRARSDAAFHRLGEWIVAAGIENDETQSLRRVYRLQDAIERDRLILDIEVAQQLGIGGDKIICAIDLNAVTRVVDDGHIGIACGCRKLANRASHIGNAEIAPQVDDVEARLFEDVAHGRGIAIRVSELGNIFIVGNSKDQRDALVGERIGCDHQGQGDCQGKANAQATHARNRL
jgi:hypothetical protein